MRQMFKVCAGIDVHKASVFVCLLKVQPDHGVVSVVRTLGTTTRELLRLLDWLTAEGCESVAMESTGVYWKPVFNLLEGAMQVLLANAQHIKALPGRKTDVQDCEWIADLHLHGLVHPSFIPPAEIRVLRDLVRTRTTLTSDRSRQANRIQKILEDANIKLGNVTADVLGVSGRAMLDRIVAGDDDPAALAELARGRMRSKRPQLREALYGRIKPHHRLLLKTHLELIDGFDAAIAGLTQEIEEQMRPFTPLRERLDTITGIGSGVATVFISELGADMTHWRTYGHAAAWAGFVPGQHESAGKRKATRVRHGNRWLREAFVQAGWAASRANDTYMQAHFRQIAIRRGPKKAALAVGHSLFVRCVAMTHQGTTYAELGPTYFDERRKEAVTKRLVQRLERLGYKVALDTPAA